MYINIMPFYIRHLKIHSGLETALYGHQGMRVHLYPIGSVSWRTIVYACLSLAVSGFVSVSIYQKYMKVEKSHLSTGLFTIS